jgi:hypothetical protein
VRTRDTRDPQQLGEAVLSLRTGSKKKLSVLYDENHVQMMAVPPYTGIGEGIAVEQAEKYRQEFPDGLPNDIDPGGE